MVSFFNSFSGWGETESTWYVGHCWPILPAPDDRWWLWSSWWNEDWQGKLKYLEKTCPSATLSTTNPTWPDLTTVGSQQLTTWAMAQPQWWLLWAKAFNATVSTAQVIYHRWHNVIHRSVPTKLVQVVRLLTCIQEATSYPNWGLLWFSWVLPRGCWIVP
jgi:hypothetical protein